MGSCNLMEISSKMAAEIQSKPVKRLCRTHDIITVNGQFPGLTLEVHNGDTLVIKVQNSACYNIALHWHGIRQMHTPWADGPNYGSGNFSYKLKFKEQSIIDRNPHQVHEIVQDNRTGENLAMLVGKWDEAMYYVIGDPTTKPKGYDPITEAVLLWERGKSIIKTKYNLSPFAISLNELTPGLLELLPPTDSRLRPDQSHLENGENELVNVEKSI
ncbi:Multicopper oxidase, N-terminal [Dillenia turbinata]|uniref:Multicopper oxidase, N-terminal n=1 Tax=Dillenia turbinata TaxID=194707 RepID=A0AAN8Z061_9MAGN